VIALLLLAVSGKALARSAPMKSCELIDGEKVRGTASSADAVFACAGSTDIEHLRPRRQRQMIAAFGDPV
jgi:hypothetical protein